jgi:DNA repair exonuclease SbcCD ATPase subunit
MNIKTQLLKYQEEMEDLEKKGQRIKGALDVEYAKLREELNEDSKVSSEKLLIIAQDVLKDLQEGIEEMNSRLEALMQEIEEKYEELENPDEMEQ